MYPPVCIQFHSPNVRSIILTHSPVYDPHTMFSTCCSYLLGIETIGISSLPQCVLNTCVRACMRVLRSTHFHNWPWNVNEMKKKMSAHCTLIFIRRANGQFGCAAHMPCVTSPARDQKWKKTNYVCVCVLRVCISSVPSTRNECDGIM